jgi:hypothetical protein
MVIYSVVGLARDGQSPKFTKLTTAQDINLRAQNPMYGTFTLHVQSFLSLVSWRSQRYSLIDRPAKLSKATVRSKIKHFFVNFLYFQRRSRQVEDSEFDGPNGVQIRPKLTERRTSQINSLI